MLAGGGVGPFAGGAFPSVRSCETNEQAAARCIDDVANHPVATPATAVGEVMAAYRLGITRETVCQISGLRGHVAHAAALVGEHDLPNGGCHVNILRDRRSRSLSQPPTRHGPPSPSSHSSCVAAGTGSPMLNASAPAARYVLASAANGA
jgi:hypothetical protein